MNNDLEQFSVERLEELSNENIICKVSWDERVALARIALSVKQAVPAGYLENWKGFMYEPRHKDLIKNPTPVYTTPQPAHTEQDDTRRMNWLVSQHVEVRMPMVYGSHARFVAQCDSDDCEEYHTTLREQIDKACAAAPKPESE